MEYYNGHINKRKRARHLGYIRVSAKEQNLAGQMIDMRKMNIPSKNLFGESGNHRVSPLSGPGHLGPQKGREPADWELASAAITPNQSNSRKSSIG